MAGVPQLRSHGADSQVKALRSSFRWIDLGAIGGRGRAERRSARSNPLCLSRHD